MIPTPSTVSRKSGRKTAKRPTTALGRFLFKYVQDFHINQSLLAKRLGVKPYVITRLLYNDTPTLIQQWRIDAIETAFSFDAMNRRTFLDQMRKAGLAALLVASGKTGLEPPSSVPTLDLDTANEIAELLEIMIEQTPHHLKTVQAKAKQWMDKLEIAQALYRDKRIAQTQFRFGMLFARTLGSDRDRPNRQNMCIATYNHLEQIVLQFPAGALAHEHARIFEQRAPLYRQLGQLDKSWFEFTLAIEEMQRNDPHNLLFTLYRSRAHIHAQQGNEEKWQRDLEVARRLVDRLQGSAKDNFLNLVDYSEGEGYKKMALSQQLLLSPQQRKRYVEKALAAFSVARTTAHEHWRGHLLMIELAEIECLLIAEPHEVLHRLAGIQPVAEAYLPSMLAKIEHLQNIVKRLLKAEDTL